MLENSQAFGANFLRSTRIRTQLQRLSFNSPKNVSRDKCGVSTVTMFANKNEGSKGQITFTCIFCEQPHANSKSFKAEKMKYKDKKKIIVQKKRACFSCLNIGHLSPQCKSNIKCLVMVIIYSQCVLRNIKKTSLNKMI